MAIPIIPEVPASDFSGQIIDAIFGDGWENILDLGAIAAPVAQNMVFPIIGAFNTIALFAVAIFLIILFTQGVVGTAHEGTAMGKRFHNVWVPLRGAFAVVLLTPIVGGMSLFQIGILSCIGWSINFGNYLWEIGLSTFVNHGGVLTTTAPQELQEDSETLAKNILLSTTYQSYFRDWQSNNLPGGNVYTSVWDNATKKYILTFNSPVGSDIPQGAFGEIQIECPEGQADALCVDRYSAVNTLISAAQAVGDNISKPDQSATKGDLITAIDDYNLSIVTAMQNRFASLPDMTIELDGFKASATEGGWLSAAPYYWTISAMNQKRRNLITAPTSMQPPSVSKIKPQAFKDINVVESKYNDFVKTEFIANSIAVLDTEGDGNVAIGFLKKIMAWLFAEQAYTFLVNRLVTEDPVVALIEHGHFIITGANVMFLTLVSFSGVTFAAEGVSDNAAVEVVSAVTTLGTADGALASLSGVTKTILIPVILMLFLALYVFGFTLAFYLPAIPMIYFLSAAISWIILVLEAVVAAPLWVASHAMAEGEGPIGNNAKQGYFLMLSILMRPALIITGFFFSIIIIQSFGKIVNFSFTALGLNIANKFISGPGFMVAMSVILCTSLLIFCQKIFLLIAKLPIEVTRWVGQYFHNLGEDSDESRVSHAFQGASHKIEGGIGSSTGVINNDLGETRMARNSRRRLRNTPGDHAARNR